MVYMWMSRRALDGEGKAIGQGRTKGLLCKDIENGVIIVDGRIHGTLVEKRNEGRKFHAA